MPRIRYLKPDFFKDEDLATLPFETRLFFAGLWNFADKAGRLEDRPLRLKVEIFPYDKVDINKCLELLSKPKNGSQKPFIQRYEIDGEHFIQIINWDKHQKPHHTEANSKIPKPPTYNTKGMEKGMEMEKQHEGSKELRNGELTVKKPLAPLNFLDSLKTNVAYKHINIEVELAKMDAWLALSRNKNRKKTDRFILNWLNRIDKPVNLRPEPQPQTRKDHEKEKSHDPVVVAMIHKAAQEIGKAPPSKVENERRI